MSDGPSQTDAHEQTPYGLQKMVNDCVEGTVMHGTTLRMYYLDGIPGREKDFFMNFFSQFAALTQFTSGMLRGTESGEVLVKNVVNWLETDISEPLNRGGVSGKSQLKEHALRGLSLSSEYVGALVQAGIISIRK